MVARHFGQRLKAGSPVTLEEVDEFRDTARIGQRLRCRLFSTSNGPTAPLIGVAEVADTCILKRKFPHVAVTDKGDLQWTMLTIWNRHAKTREYDMVTASGDIRLIREPEEDVW